MNRQILDDKILPNSTLTIKLDKPILPGDSMSLKNEKLIIVDKVTIDNDNSSSCTEYRTYQRDTVVIASDNKVLTNLSRFKRTTSEGTVISLYEENRNTTIFSFDHDKNMLVSSYKIKEINYERTRIYQHEGLNSPPQSYSVYPNPVETILNIKVPKAEKTCYKIETLHGQPILYGYEENEVIQVDMTKYPPNLYLLVLGEEENQQTIKIEKK